MIPEWRGRSSWDDYRRVRHDPIGFMSDVLRACGEFVRVDFLAIRFYLVNDPGLVREALVEKADTFIIKGGVSRGLARLIGDGILTNRGEDWRRSRASLQPLFHQSALDEHGPVIAARVQESLDRWRETAGVPFCLNRELLALSCRIACSTLFRWLPSFADALEFADAIWVLQLDGMERYLAGGDYTPWLPSARNRKVNGARAALIRFAERAVGAGAGVPVDEILSILFAGTESPVNTLCFALTLLAEHPEWRDRLVADLTATGSDGDETDPFKGMESFDLLSQVMSECVRLYPAGWAFERYAAADVTLGGEPLRKGARLVFSPFLMHRNPRFWREPERFDPARFARGPTAVEGVPKYGYMPFGAGPRSCIGSRLALAEMRVALRMILTRCRWTIDDHPGDPPLTPGGSFKLRLSRPLFVKMEFPPRARATGSGSGPAPSSGSAPQTPPPKGTAEPA